MTHVDFQHNYAGYGGSTTQIEKFMGQQPSFSNANDPCSTLKDPIPNTVAGQPKLRVSRPSKAAFSVANDPCRLCKHLMPDVVGVQPKLRIS